MIENIVLARLGDTVDEVVVLEWMVGPGDRVAVGDPLVRVETDKVEVEVESPRAGVIVECFVGIDDDIKTGASLCSIEILE
jgi:pyruvate/2-oxoglutarate dehydrogenase complex dihydrolipoamide acyltransferase (E2) component